MLNIENLSVRFGGKQVLRDVTVSLRPNRLTALVGRNGAGKSTLLACVNQQIPYTGTISVEERDLAKMPPRERAKAVAILPQSLPAPHITAWEMTALGRNPYLDFTGRLRENDKKTVESALRAVDALDLAERYVDTLSGGEKQRIALAMILAQNAPAMLLDEPTAHMDLGCEDAFLELLQRLKGEQSKTFLVILHDLTQAVRYADDLIVLEGGNMVFAGSREECLEKKVLEKTFHLRRYTVTDEAGERVFFGAK